MEATACWSNTHPIAGKWKHEHSRSLSFALNRYRKLPCAGGHQAQLGCLTIQMAWEAGHARSEVMENSLLYFSVEFPCDEWVLLLIRHDSRVSQLWLS